MSPLDPSTSYDRIADRYEEVRGGEARARPLAEALARWIEPGSAVLDVGAGTGIVTAALESAGYDVRAAIDLSRPMLNRAAGRLPGRIVRADAQALPFGAATVDAVTMVWVLHHVGRPELALGEARRVLRPKWRIVVISGIPIPGSDELSPIYAELDAVRPRPTRTSDVAAAAAEAGVELIHTDIAHTDYSQSPNGLAEQIRQRLYAPLWDLDAATWDERVEPLIRRVQAMPDPDRPRIRSGRHPVFVFEA